MALLFSLILAICTGSGLTEPSLGVRLVGGRHRCEGRVEVEQEGGWGAVCDDGWDMTDVAVVCRERGCGEAKGTPSGILYKPSTEEEQKILIQDVNCNGMEDKLSQCDYQDVFACSYNESAGALCEKPSFGVRLVGGRHRCEGLVEVEQKGGWGAVCDDGWDMKDVAVVCRELGCGEAKGTTSDLQPMFHFFAEPSFGVRLVGGRHRCEGRVEVEQEGGWGAVCDDGWDMKDVAVVCRELGCGEAKGTPSGILYKPSTEEEQKILIQDVNCNGMEDKLSQCEHEDVFACSYNESAGASCESEYGRAEGRSANCSYPT
ncbi:CD5 antigen-like [Diceros bicornis minor]|uniref:CD5 antigen-like n=1 Tax=Diceros bicornis minor TaxID=77932 RepID=UPI0026EFD086|nr:CD5 antigen-like [Diceros bicornis minor]